MSAHAKKPPIEEIVPSSEEEGTPWEVVAREDIEEFGMQSLMLRGARFREELTQEELAEKLGIDPSIIVEIEKGEREIDEEMARRLAKVLNAGYKIFL